MEKVAHNPRCILNDITSSIKIRGNIDVIINKHWLGDGRDNQIGVLTKSFSDLSKAKRRKNTEGDGYESWNDNISAIAVQKRSDVCFYDDVEYNGQEVCLVPGTVVANLTDIDFNDRIKSIKFNRGGFYLEAHIGLHENFKGEEHVLDEDVPDVSTYEGGIFTDGITAIGAFIDGAGPVACPKPKKISF